MTGSPAPLDLAEPPRELVDLAAATPARNLTQRRGLPNTRAVLGGLLVTLAAVSAFALAADDPSPDERQIVVAVEPIAPGDVITEASLERRTLVIGEDTASRFFTDPSELVGAVALGPAGEGDLIQRGNVRLDAPPPEGRIVSVTVPESAAMGGDLLPGDRVDLIATTGGPGSSSVVARNAVVVSVRAAGEGTLVDEGSVLLTLQVKDEEQLLGIVDASVSAEALTVVPSGGPDGPVNTTGATSGEDGGTDSTSGDD